MVGRPLCPPGAEALEESASDRPERSHCGANGKLFIESDAGLPLLYFAALDFPPMTNPEYQNLVPDDGINHPVVANAIFAQACKPSF